MSGYNDSTTWQAWVESLEVLWNNTSILFLISVLASLVIIIITWIVVKDKSPQNIKSCRQQSVKEMTKIDEEDEDETEDQTDGRPMTGIEKKRELESLASNMTEQQRLAERDAQSQQLAAIFKMMQEQEEKFGETSIDEIKDQMKLYCG